jgi:hypothetical protein
MAISGLKMALKRERFDSTDTIKAYTTRHLSNIPKDAFKKQVSNKGKTAGISV